MGIRIEKTAHGASPVIVCDYCGTRIHAAREGNYEWAGISTAPGERVAVYFLHKWCSPAHEALHGITLESMELSVMLPHLAQNLRVDWDEALRHAELLNEF